MNHIIEEQFNKIRETYFPQWDRKREWKLSTLEIDVDMLTLAVCDTSTKTVTIPENTLRGTERQLRQLIIHEIAHAVGNTAHGVKWRKRIEKAALKAESLNETEVAQGLRQEIEWYSDPDNEPRIPVSFYYHAIKMAVFDNPDKSYEDIMSEFPKSMGGDGFLYGRLRRGPKVYEQAKRFRMKFATREEAWDAWFEKHPQVIDEDEQF